MTAQYILNDIWNEGFEDGLGGFHMYAPYSGDEYQAYATGWQTGIDRRKREGKLDPLVVPFAHNARGHMRDHQEHGASAQERGGGGGLQRGAFRDGHPGKERGEPERGDHEAQEHGAQRAGLAAGGTGHDPFDRAGAPR